jgi:hypothetical protein
LASDVISSGNVANASVMRSRQLVGAKFLIAYLDRNGMQGWFLQFKTKKRSAGVSPAASAVRHECSLSEEFALERHSRLMALVCGRDARAPI